MTKRRSALNADQLAFTFEAPPPARHEASLAGLDQMISAAVSRVLKEDERTRFEIAGKMSELLNEEVTKWMLDAYASEARDQHNISAGRFFALIAATDRFDVLDAIVTRIGARVLVGEEVHTARLGHLEAQMRHIQEQLKEARQMARPISRGGRGK